MQTIKGLTNEKKNSHNTPRKIREQHRKKKTYKFDDKGGEFVLSKQWEIRKKKRNENQ